MKVKNLKFSGWMLLLMLMSAVSASPVKANPAVEEASETIADEAIFLSQSLGHLNYPGATQTTWFDFNLGTVKGKAGSIVCVELQDGTVFWESYPAAPGNNVLVVKENGKYTIASIARSYWVRNLVEDYRYRLENDKKLEPPLQQRTAPIWRSLGY